MYSALVVCTLASTLSVNEKPYQPTAGFCGTHSQIKKERFVCVRTDEEWKVRARFPAPSSK